ncbi:hypothetical protein JTB14_034986 [Gonioctena quinquepunctata]|nr:hypothetical protein JTB14_034986 [Gonioctena quinquepunctata]
MSDNETHSEVSKEEIAKISGNMKCCNSKKCSVYVCINCFAVYHQSCAKRYPNIKIIGETKVTCCSSEKMAENGDKQKQMCLELENRYLRELIDEIKDKNMVLRMNNELLLERMKRLENEKAAASDRNNLKMTYKGVAMRPPRREHNIEKSQEKGVEMRSSQQTNTQISAQQTTSTTSSEAPIPEQHGGRNEHSELVMGSEYDLADEKEDGFKTIQRKRRKAKRLGTGAVEANQEFGGEERKVWLYINRVKRSATAEMVKKYMEKKSGFEKENIEVRELPTNENRLKAFVVTAPLSRKDELYDRSFWPNYVGINRFDFNRHKDFLQNRGDFFQDRRDYNV